MNNKKINNILIVFIIFLTSFILGIFFTLFLDNILENTMLKTKKYNIETNLKEQEGINLSKYDKVYNIIRNYYYDNDKLTDDDLINGSINGLVDGIGDKHSDYLTPEEYKQFNDNLSGDFEGIGAVIEINPLGVEVDRILKGSPAKKNDLRSGDIIIKANEIELTGMSLLEAVNNIKGPKGTNVELSILREGVDDIITKNVTRDQIKIPSIDYELLDDNIGYVSINTFGEETFVDFQSALLELKDTNGLVIDLRDNGGGFLISAVEILSKFVEKGNELVLTKYKDDTKNHSYKSNNYGYLYKGKVVVLINQNSASASEIVAGALSDYNKAIIVGKKSYGKGSVQEPFILEDDSMVKLTIAKWFTPKGLNIDKEGIEPDIEVGFLEEDYQNEYDRQKEKSIEVLKNFISKGNIDLVISDYVSEKNEEK